MKWVRQSLSSKLILAFLAVSLLGVSLVAIFAQLIVVYEFRSFLQILTPEETVERIAQSYQETHSWEETRHALRGIRALDNTQLQMDSTLPALRNFVVTNQEGRVILPGPGFVPGSKVPTSLLAQGMPIVVEGETVGTFILNETHSELADWLERLGTSWQTNTFFGGFRHPMHRLFTRRVNQSLLYAALSAVLLSFLVGILLERRLIRPLKEITAAIRGVGQGELNQQVPVRSQDEVGVLAESFNHMNTSLAKQQHLRRQMTADIAHELRTPISIILGHAEGLNDGVLPATTETFQVIQDESEHLRRLVEDLRTLSLVEAGELHFDFQTVAILELLEQSIAAHKPIADQKEIALILESPDRLPTLPPIHVDVDRILQVLSNLLSNALRYTPVGGTVVISAKSPETEQAVEISVSDNGLGLTSVELENVFHRFYRGDKSRHRNTQQNQQQRTDSGSGLGLAIAKSIVEGHEGRIWAESQSNAGATFIFRLPI
ncbi:MAG: ATP-binding protein [Chloroflexota bacterium]